MNQGRRNRYLLLKGQIDWRHSAMVHLEEAVNEAFGCDVLTRINFCELPSEINRERSKEIALTSALDCTREELFELLNQASRICKMRDLENRILIIEERLGLKVNRAE